MIENSALSKNSYLHFCFMPKRVFFLLRGYGTLVIIIQHSHSIYARGFGCGVSNNCWVGVSQWCRKFHFKCNYSQVPFQLVLLYKLQSSVAPKWNKVPKSSKFLVFYFKNIHKKEGVWIYFCNFVLLRKRTNSFWLKECDNLRFAYGCAWIKSFLYTVSRVNGTGTFPAKA